MKYLHTFFLAFILCVASAYAEPAPQFSVKDIGGTTYTLPELKGKIVVLEWFSPSCPFDKKHYESGSIQKLQEKLTTKGIVWLSIDSSGEGRPGSLSPSEAQELQKSWKIKSTAVVLDPDGSLGRKFGARTTPHLFVIDTQGDLAYQGAIDDQPSASKSSLDGAHNYVEAAVDELLAGKKVSVPATESYGCSIKYALS